MTVVDGLLGANEKRTYGRRVASAQPLQSGHGELLQRMKATKLKGVATTVDHLAHLLIRCVISLFLFLLASRMAAGRFFISMPFRPNASRRPAPDTP